MEVLRRKKRGWMGRLLSHFRADEDEMVPGIDSGRSSRLYENKNHRRESEDGGSGWIEAENEEMELAVDVYQTPAEIVLQAFVAGVQLEDLELTIARDIITIRGKRQEGRSVDEENYFLKELYWGRFSRTVLLPQEVEPEEVEATERHGLLTVRIQKVDKEKKNSIRVKSV